MPEQSETLQKLTDTRSPTEQFKEDVGIEDKDKKKKEDKDKKKKKKGKPPKPPIKGGGGGPDKKKDKKKEDKKKKDKKKSETLQKLTDKRTPGEQLRESIGAGVDISKKEKEAAERAGLGREDAKQAIIEAKEEDVSRPSTAQEFADLAATRSGGVRARGGTTPAEASAQQAAIKRTQVAEKTTEAQKELEETQKAKKKISEEIGQNIKKVEQAPEDAKFRVGDLTDQEVVRGPGGGRAGSITPVKEVGKERALEILRGRKERAEESFESAEQELEKFIGRGREAAEQFSTIEEDVSDRGLGGGKTVEREFRELPLTSKFRVFGRAAVSGSRSAEAGITAFKQAPVTSVLPQGIKQAAAPFVSDVSFADLVGGPTPRDVGVAELREIRREQRRPGQQFLGSPSAEQAAEFFGSVPGLVVTGFGAGAASGKAVAGLKSLGKTGQAFALESLVKGTGALAGGAGLVDVGRDFAEGDVQEGLETGLEFGAVGVGFSKGFQRFAGAAGSGRGRAGRFTEDVRVRTRGVGDFVLSRRGVGELSSRSLPFTQSAPAQVARVAGRRPPTNLLRVGNGGGSLTNLKPDFLEAELPFTQSAPTQTAIKGGPGIFKGSGRQRFIVQQKGPGVFRGGKRVVDINLGNIEATRGGGFAQGEAQVFTTRRQALPAGERISRSPRFLQESVRGLEKGFPQNLEGEFPAPGRFIRSERVRSGSIVEAQQTGRVFGLQRGFSEQFDLPVGDVVAASRRAQLKGLQLDGFTEPLQFTVRKPGARALTSGRLLKSGEGVSGRGLSVTDVVRNVKNTEEGFTNIKAVTREIGTEGSTGLQQARVKLFEDVPSLKVGRRGETFTGSGGQVSVQRQGAGGAVDLQVSAQVVPQVVSNIRGMSAAKLSFSQQTGGGLTEIPTFITASDLAETEAQEAEAQEDVDPAPFRDVRAGQQQRRPSGVSEEVSVVSPPQLSSGRRGRRVSGKDVLTGMDRGLETDTGLGTELGERGRLDGRRDLDLGRRGDIGLREARITTPRTGLGVREGLDIDIRKRNIPRERLKTFQTGPAPAPTTVVPGRPGRPGAGAAFSFGLPGSRTPEPGFERGGGLDVGFESPGGRPEVGLLSATIAELGAGRATRPGEEAVREFEEEGVPTLEALKTREELRGEAQFIKPANINVDLEL